MRYAWCVITHHLRKLGKGMCLAMRRGCECLEKVSGWHVTCLGRAAAEPVLLFCCQGVQCLHACVMFMAAHVALPT